MLCNWTSGEHGWNRGECLEDHARTWKWLVTIVSFRPLRIGLWDPFQMPFPWLSNGQKAPEEDDPFLGVFLGQISSKHLALHTQFVFFRHFGQKKDATMFRLSEKKNLQNSTEFIDPIGIQSPP